MKAIIRKRMKKAKRRIERRLRAIAWEEQAKPMLAAKNIQYEIAEKGHAVAAGGIGAIHLVAQRSGLVELINQNVRVLKRHLPYHESDHVLSIAYNVLCGGSRLEHIEHRRLIGDREVFASTVSLHQRSADTFFDLTGELGVGEHQVDLHQLG